MENLENKQILDDTLLENVSGGANATSGAYQLYYMGEQLDMTQTVKQFCDDHPGVQQKLGIWYIVVCNMTLNKLCETYGGMLDIQGLIDENS